MPDLTPAEIGLTVALVLLATANIFAFVYWRAKSNSAASDPKTDAPVTNSKPISQVELEEEEEEDIVIDSPIQKAYMLMQKVKASSVLPSEDIEFITKIILTNKEHYELEFANNEKTNEMIDDETKAWVVETFLQSQYPRKNSVSFEVPSTKRRMSVGMSKISMGSGEPFQFKHANSDLQQSRILQSTSLIAPLEEEEEVERSSKSAKSDRVFTALNEEITRFDGKRRKSNALILKSLNTLDQSVIFSYLDQHFSSWSMDIFHVNEISSGHCMYFIGMYVFQKYRILETYKIPVLTAQMWLLMMENEYTSQPYHNSVHGADVLHAMTFLALENNFVQTKMSINEVFASVIAALGHDVDHPGVNNAFQVKTRAKRALLYSDQSINENHHCASVFLRTLENQEQNIFAQVANEDFEEVRKNIIRLILATDMAKHFQYLAQFKTKYEAGALDSLDSSENRMVVLEMAIKCADLSNPAKPFEICRKWVDSVMEEFYLQGDKERALNMPISQFMDRNNQNIPKSQIGFIEILVSPLYEAFSAFSLRQNDSKFVPVLHQMMQNKSVWTAMNASNPDLHAQTATANGTETVASQSTSRLKTDDESRRESRRQLHKKSNISTTSMPPEFSPHSSSHNINSLDRMKIRIDLSKVERVDSKSKLSKKPIDAVAIDVADQQ